MEATNHKQLLILIKYGAYIRISYQAGAADANAVILSMDISHMILHKT